MSKASVDFSQRPQLQSSFHEKRPLDVCRWVSELYRLFFVVISNKVKFITTWFQFTFPCKPSSLTIWDWKKTSLLPEIDRVKNILSLTRPYSRICIRICKVPTNCFSVFNHFVGLALKGLGSKNIKQTTTKNKSKKKQKKLMTKREYHQKIE